MENGTEQVLADVKDALGALTLATEVSVATGVIQVAVADTGVKAVVDTLDAQYGAKVLAEGDVTPIVLMSLGGIRIFVVGQSLLS